MKRLALLLALVPMLASAEDIQVLYMTAYRTIGNGVSVPLYDKDDFVGPVLNLQENRLHIGNASILKSRITGIKFEVRTIDAIEAPQADVESQNSEAPVYDLQGRQMGKESLTRGIYIRNGKKFVKK